MRYCYLLTEGSQDIAFIICLLKFYKLKRITQRNKIDDFWLSLIPSTFPPEKNQGNIEQPVPIPKFLQNNNVSIAIQGARGIENLVNTLEETLDSLSLNNLELDSIGIILDADYQESPNQRFKQSISELQRKPFPITLPLENLQLGEVREKTDQSPAFGVFILPNNKDQGTLEDILLDCARENYSNLYDLGIEYINNIDREQLTKEDLKELKKPTGENKALLSTIVSILKPTRTLQVSLQDNRWLDETTINLPSVILIKEFLEQITGIGI